MAAARACIFGVGGLALTSRERDFLRAADPWGFILFSRNVDTPAQVAALVAELRDAVGRKAPVLIDQEGGRVARLRPPHWRGWRPVAEIFDGRDEAVAREALALRYRVIAAELAALGIDVDCMPLLDLPTQGSHDVIGARALGTEPARVAERARVVCDALKAGGVLPVIKHLPGHGRSTVDSHEGLPRVSTDFATLDATDFAAFRPLAGEALGMTAHIVYEAIDAERCATLSPDCISLIRQGIGFDGCLMTDDLSMHALTGPMGARAADAIAAGCDLILHCNGDMPEMEAIAEATPRLAGQALARAQAALDARATPDAFDVDAAYARYLSLTGEDVHA
ncbi:glycoside hydrolase family 3 protein [Limibaculum sp. M0105]|uniref:beta-N-acetylhexosaminidase n=1 Tax=Thermohalobaculum xanthum TaxID=2753746 RepID=A0A8J7SCR2_9RHOB|nr:glycoside hydrolase family 3 protein [Thermohalobaculum xanthum]MBK0398401.1 glycoside hydrolase family 3 protein [Thermohalobaculum xanthum]